MEKFENVAVTVKANVYFNGQVTSRAVTFADGSTKTLGIMQPGEYEFGTAEAELMEITAGKLQVLLPNETEWRAVVGGESFNVPANVKFKVKVEELADYVCSYLAD
ncbi:MULTISPECIES: pyrimidine/purine nucleoside phosphorylase [Corallincola]|uniref:Pyrimidine/purine nucleoside phosphorylase n=3 Tax=Corallincola TaxID=1775176 RepID=A0A368NKT6_9GAMM|nr:MULTISPECIES: pyrimidine/purine nucleoside phosphorylase [Corallincola]RCU50483.1 pyrimidine/purine nucleoside phosphorylase [Corallincola holothuriorum]TAA48510.1 pyrimidine/purine nucleoside phosphorylase [Corallincola spongiicola]TCI01808.1 pyrimidine/purine nucleoside phosphorylase [Corallincola luteus]